MMHARSHLKARLLGALEAAQRGWTVEDLDRLARDVYAWQVAHNAPYQAFALTRGAAPERLTSWRDIPPVPTEVFRHVTLFCGDVADAAHTFRTSGTTSGARGAHHLRDLDVYHASAGASIWRYLLPDRRPRPVLALAASPQTTPDSSLISMMGLIGDRCAPAPPVYAWTDAGRLDVPRALAWLQQAASAPDAPVLVLATSFALVELLDAMEADGVSLQLPPESIVMPTGGTKGRTRAVTADEVDAAITARLGVAPPYIVAEYGMTELGSQLYAPQLAAHIAHRPINPARVLAAPPWCRVTAHDPSSGAELPPGERGLLAFLDLANLDSVVRVLTADMGRVIDAAPTGDVIVLEGRAPGSVARGCSLALEETWEASRFGDDAP